MGNIYIYGAGVYGKQCYEYLKSQGITVDAFIVTKKDNNPQTLFELPILGIDEIKEESDNSKIYIALKTSYRAEVLKELTKKNISNFDFYPEIKIRNLQPLESYINSCIERNFQEQHLRTAEMINNAQLSIEKNIANCITKSLETKLPKRKDSARKKEVQKLSGYKVFFDYLDHANIKICNEKSLIKNLLEKKSLILLFSHDFSLTGAPVALMNFALALKQIGKSPIITSPIDGPLSKELKQRKIPFFVMPNLFGSDFFEQTESCYEAIVANTIIGAPIITKIRDSSKPIIWWIHEAEDSYSQENIAQMPVELPDNVKVYCPGSWARQTLLTHRPQYKNIEQLLYTTPDRQKKLCFSHNKSKAVFLSVGTIQSRKGQDILAEAIFSLPIEYIKKSMFYIVGKDTESFTSERIFTLAKVFPENIKILDCMPQKELFKIYEQTDCLICSSRDDPMPIVVTDAFSMSKLVICSENTGSANLIKEMNGGFVYNGNSSKNLADCIKNVITNLNSKEFRLVRKNARKIYTEHFTTKAFKQNIKKIFESIEQKNLQRNETVSVVIPTWNAGEDIKKLFACLARQNYSKEIETIIVDSESSDDTVLYAQQQGAKVISIKQKDFSHSSARNLGAEQASGKYILFITQDALPYDDSFISKMLGPIQKKQAVAVSCRQTPRPDSDLLCRVQNFYDAEANTKDELLSMPKDETYESLRKNARLENVACMLRKDIFDKYKYRGEFAEDLDLGLRLIKDGHTLAYLSSTKVIHSHNRSAFYHFKRAIVDIYALNKITSYPYENITLSSLMNQTTTALFVLNFIFAHRKEFDSAPTLQDFWQLFDKIKEKALDAASKCLAANIIDKLKSSDIHIEKQFYELLIKTTAFISFETNGIETKLAEQQTSFICKTAKHGLEKLGIVFYKGLSDEILDMYVKFFGLSTGFLFGNHLVCDCEKDKDFITFIKGYTSGI